MLKALVVLYVATFVQVTEFPFLWSTLYRFYDNITVFVFPLFTIHVQFLGLSIVIAYD